MYRFNQGHIPFIRTLLSTRSLKDVQNFSFHLIKHLRGDSFYPEFRDLVIFPYLSFYFYHHSRMQKNSLHSIFQQNKIKCNSSIPTTIGIIVNLSEKGLYFLLPCHLCNDTLQSCIKMGQSHLGDQTADQIQAECSVSTTICWFKLIGSGQFGSVSCMQCNIDGLHLFYF